MMFDSTLQPRVAIIGGGLAGLSAAVHLVDSPWQVELFEAKRVLGGRAGSFMDPATGETVDHCQHVAMGCCEELLAFLRLTGGDDLWRRDRVLHFFSPGGRRSDLRSTAWLPTPLHWVPSLFKLPYLGGREKLGIARTMHRLRKLPPRDTPSTPTVGQWLREQGETKNAITGFWSMVLVSALGESLEKASLTAARKVFVDGFLASRTASDLFVPTVPLNTVYDTRIVPWLEQRDAKIHRESPVRRLIFDGERVTGLKMSDGRSLAFDAFIVAVPWKSIPRLMPVELHEKLPALQTAVQQITGSPITSVHLWFDAPVMNLPHAVLVGRLSQWVFRHHANYYQVVISASHELAGRDHDDILTEVIADLSAIWPDAVQANLERSRIVTQPNAVFSARPGLDSVRPGQQTSVTNLHLAGDWTATGWPSTMEGAVISGRLAAEGVIAHHRK